MSNSFNQFLPSVTFHTETSRLICKANQMTGFYMKCNTRVNLSNNCSALFICFFTLLIFLPIIYAKIFGYILLTFLSFRSSSQHIDLTAKWRGDMKLSVSQMIVLDVPRIFGTRSMSNVRLDGEVNIYLISLQHLVDSENYCTFCSKDELGSLLQFPKDLQLMPEQLFRRTNSVTSCAQKKVKTNV